MSVRLPRGYRATAELEVKRSRFITTLARVEDEVGARDVVAEVRRTWPDARHHCTAFVVQVPGAQPVERSSDDGEPSGTAGRPMLDVLRGAGLEQVVAVVTRYFGGVKLGTGGLVRAYSDAVHLAVADAPLVRPVRTPVFEVTFSYADAARAADAFATHGLTVIDSSYAAQVTLRVAGDVAAVRGLAAQIVHDDVEVRALGEHVLEDRYSPVTGLPG